MNPSTLGTLSVHDCTPIHIYTKGGRISKRKRERYKTQIYQNFDTRERVTSTLTYETFWVCSRQGIRESKTNANQNVVFFTFIR